jgi:hypothetical protein
VKGRNLCGTVWVDIVEEGAGRLGTADVKCGWALCQPQPTIYDIGPIRACIGVSTMPDAARLITGYSGQVNSRRERLGARWSGNQ